MVHWSIKFSNGYRQDEFNVVNGWLADLAFFTGSRTVYEIHNNVRLWLDDSVWAETKDRAEAYLHDLVTYLQGVMDVLEDSSLLNRLVGYMYDALSLAEIVPYADRLN